MSARAVAKTSNRSEIVDHNQRVFDIDAIPAAHRIPRISAKAAPLFFDEFYRSERPVIITGLVKQWPCFDKWSIDYFKSIIGAHTHTFRYEEGRTIALSVAAYLDVLAASEDGGDGYRTSTRSLRAVPRCCTRRCAKATSCSSRSTGTTTSTTSPARSR